MYVSYWVFLIIIIQSTEQLILSESSFTSTDDLPRLTGCFIAMDYPQASVFFVTITSRNPGRNRPKSPESSKELQVCLDSEFPFFKPNGLVILVMPPFMSKSMHNIVQNH